VGALTADMKRLVGEQRLGFYATVCEDGSPNLSPKGTTLVLDDDHLRFAPAYDAGGVSEEEIARLFFDRLARRFGAGPTRP